MNRPMSCVRSFCLRAVAALRAAACAMLLALAAWPSLQAQGSDDGQARARSFVESMAKTVYGVAWPTAKYRSATISGFEPARGGFDVIVTLSGLSGLDGSDLWVKLAFVFRDGTLQGVRVQDHNAIIAPPFATSITLANAGAALAKAYADDQQARASR